jgi:hypothetical protein
LKHWSLKGQSPSRLTCKPNQNALLNDNIKYIYVYINATRMENVNAKFTEVKKKKLVTYLGLAELD